MRLRVAHICKSSNSPYLSAKISGPPTLSLSTPFTLTVTLYHHENPKGNPRGKPVIFKTTDTGATELDGISLGCFLVLHHNRDKLREVDDNDNGCRLGVNESVDEETLVLLDNGFISLAPGESYTENIGFTYEILDLEVGQKYSLLYKGWYIQWWKWGTLEVSLKHRVL